MKLTRKQGHNWLGKVSHHAPFLFQKKTMDPALASTGRQC